MIFVLKLVGWALVGFAPILAGAVVAADAPPGAAGAMALWTVLPVLVSGAMLIAFAEMIAYVRAIDRTVAAQYALLVAHRPEPPLPEPRIGRLSRV